MLLFFCVLFILDATWHLVNWAPFNGYEGIHTIEAQIGDVIEFYWEGYGDIWQFSGEQAFLDCSFVLGETFIIDNTSPIIYNVVELPVYFGDLHQCSNGLRVQVIGKIKDLK